MTPGPDARAGAGDDPPAPRRGPRHAQPPADPGPADPDPAGRAPEAPADTSLRGFLDRHDDLLQQRAVVVAHLHGVEAPELYALAVAALGTRWEELAPRGESDRRDVFWLLLARHARTLGRRPDPPGTAGPPRSHADRAALDAVRDLLPPWRYFEARGLLTDRETVVFRAMAHLSEPARDVLVLFWLGVGADDVADDLRMSPPTVGEVLADARAQLRHVLAALGASS